MATDNTDGGLTTATLGPYIAAAAVLTGASNGDIDARISEVIAIGVKIATRAGGAIPIRSISVTGVLSIGSTANAHRTQIGVNTGTSKYGADEMWTEYEADTAAAARTRAVLQSLVGTTVRATKQTFLEYYGDGRPVYNDKNEHQTRTRLQPGSLYVVDADGATTPVDFAAAAAPPATPRRGRSQRAAQPAAGPAAAPSDKPPHVDAQTAYVWLVEQIGEDRASQAWAAEQLPATGQIARAAFNAVRSRHVPTPVPA